MSGVAILFVWWAEKLPQKTWWAQKYVQISLAGKINTYKKTNNRASLILIIPLSTLITSNTMKCNSSSYKSIKCYIIFSTVKQI